MKYRHSLAAAALVMMCQMGGARVLAAESASYRRAVSLYSHGMFDQARSVLQALPGKDAMTDGYTVLCALRTGSRAAEMLVKDYVATYGETVLSPEIHFWYAESLFESGLYEEASEEFLLVDEKKISSKEVERMAFDQAFSDYSSGRREEARYRFGKIASSGKGQYLQASRYFSGVLAYEAMDFSEAEEFFRASADDSRFRDNSLYYLLECRFMQKDYAYVAANAESVYFNVPEERRHHLSRIISEAFLVLGDTEKAAKFYSGEQEDMETMTRSDHFYAGSLQYALKNWSGALTHFSAMGDSRDSLSQIALYQSGYCMVETRNKVAALDAFRAASELDYRSDITEDALFNYAKLAFDLNTDYAPFKTYIDKYSDTRKGNQIYSYMALAALAGRDYAAAVEAYDQIDELDEDMRANYMKANYLRGIQLVSKGAYTDAVPCLRAAGFYTSKTDNFNKLTRFWLAECHYHTDNFSEAEKIYTDLYNTSALDRLPEGEDVTYSLAYCYFKQEDYRTALRWFDYYLKSGDSIHSSDAAVRKGDCLFLLRDYESAALAYSSSIRQDVVETTLYPRYQLGMSYGLAGKLDRKVLTLIPAKQADPSVPYHDDAIFELGRAYVALNQDANAISSFLTLKESSSDRSFQARSLIELGMLSRNKKDYDKALEYYKEVVSEYRDTPFRDDALIAIESIYQSKGEPETYLAYIENLGNPMNRTEDEKEMVYYNSAEQVYLSGNMDKAVAALDKYLELYPEGSKVCNAWFYLADCYKSSGNKEKACEYYSKVASSSTEGSFVELSMLNFASLSYELEHYQDAYGAYSSLLSNARLENNTFTAKTGMMRSAYRGRLFTYAIAAADTLKADGRTGSDLAREADLVKAKSYLSISDRKSAFSILEQLSSQPSTDEGAEASYLLIQDLYDRGEFDKIEDRVYAFSDGASGQSYWLAKAFVVLGDSFAERDQLEQAEVTFESVRSGYEPYGPDDDVPAAVEMRLKKLQELAR